MAASGAQRNCSAVAEIHTVSLRGGYSTIAQAVSAASDGDIVVVEDGVYRERVVIDKPLTLKGVGRPVIDGGGEGTVLSISAPGCVVKGFEIRGSGSSLNSEDGGISLDGASGTLIEDNTIHDILFGIYLRNSPNTTVRGNVVVGKELPIASRGDGIRIWYSSGTRIEENHITGTRDVVIWFSDKTLIKGNRVEKGRYGLHYMYSNDNHFVENVFSENLVGGFLMYSTGIRLYRNVFARNRGIASGYGIGLKDLDDVVMSENLFVENRVGVYIDNSPRSVDSRNIMRKNVIAFNDIGLSIMPAVERNVIVGNSIIDNTEQVEVRGGGTLRGNVWSELDRGNHWSDYVGYDDNGDGVGEVPYLAESLFESLIDRYPILRILMFSPASEAIEFASRAFPIIKPEPKMRDNHPLIKAGLPGWVSTDRGGHSPKLLGLSTLMVVASAAIYLYLILPWRGKDV
ncbi:MAG: nitrous oxide reductase family maturation protein NosD [Thermodesulfobacteriota bacterium]